MVQKKLENMVRTRRISKKKQRGRSNLEAASSSSSSIPRPPNQLVEVETPRSHWRRIIFPWSSLEEEFPNFIMELQSNIIALQNQGDRKGQGKGYWNSNTKGKRKPPRGALPKSTPTDTPKGKGTYHSQENPTDPTQAMPHRQQPAQQPPTAWASRTIDVRLGDEMKGKGQGKGKGKQSILNRPQDWWLPTPNPYWLRNQRQGNKWQENKWQEYW